MSREMTTKDEPHVNAALPPAVLETWSGHGGVPHRLRFDGVSLVVEHRVEYRDIGCIWEDCYLGPFMLPDFNDNAIGAPHE
jgi:hypothetical protein